MQSPRSRRSTRAVEGLLYRLLQSLTDFQCLFENNLLHLSLCMSVSNRQLSAVRVVRMEWRIYLKANVRVQLIADQLRARASKCAASSLRV